MGAVLCALSNIMYLGEKFALWMAIAAVLTCFLLTYLMILGLGIGLGYNYCFVDIKTKHKYVPGHYEYQLYRGNDYYYDGHRRMLNNGDVNKTLLNEVNNSEFSTNETTVSNNVTLNSVTEDSVSVNNVTGISDMDQKREVKDDTEIKLSEVFPEEMATQVPDVSSSAKTVLQIDGLDLMTLLAKLKSENRNYSLQIVTT